MSSDCIRLVVVAVTLLLSDVTCQTVHNVSISHDVRSGRQRRQAVKLTQAVKSAIVDRHNALRALEGAANMELMAWSRNLASSAASWAARCIKGHNRGGQNMMYGGNWKEVAPIIDRFYVEKEHYNVYSNKLTGLKCSGRCGHYTQVVWASSRYVGCGVHRCPYWIVTVCNYKPRGNKVGRKKGKAYSHLPYIKGPACSKCASGAGWCRNKLCDRRCSSGGTNCSYAMICYNCATLDLETCRCKCAKGWHGADCTVPCNDTMPPCRTTPDWFVKGACHKDLHFTRRCPVRCGVCKVDPNAEEGLCPPVRGPGADSAQTVFIKSHHSTMIFVMVMIAFTIISYDAL